MRWAELVLEYLRVLAWPGAVSAILIAYREQLKRGLRNLPPEGSAEIMGLGKYSWKRQVESIANETAKLTAPPTQDSPRDEPPQAQTSAEEFDRRVGMAGYNAGAGLTLDWEQLRSLATRHPEASVLRTWQRVEYLLYAFAYGEKATLGANWREDIARVSRYLGADPRTAAALGDLQDLTRAVEAGQRVSRSSALTFVDAAEAAMERWKSSSRT